MTVAARGRVDCPLAEPSLAEPPEPACYSNPMRRFTVVAASILAATTLTGCNAVEKFGLPGATSTDPATTANHQPTSPEAVTAPTGAALAAALKLPTQGRAPKTGYARAQFGKAWTDDNTALWGRNGCDTRNDILKRDLTNIAWKNKVHCAVKSGVLADKYSGTTIQFVRGASTSSAVQIDHIIPLSNAWQTGAQAWPSTKRVQFANDPLNLNASKGSLNGQKSDADAATWLPPNKAYRACYAAQMVSVRTKYGLWTTPADKATLVRLLTPHPTMKLPTGQGGVCPT